MLCIFSLNMNCALGFLIHNYVISLFARWWIIATGFREIKCECFLRDDIIIQIV